MAVSSLSQTPFQLQVGQVDLDKANRALSIVLSNITTLHAQAPRPDLQLQHSVRTLTSSAFGMVLFDRL